MNIAIDGRPILNHLTGVGRYTSELVNALYSENNEHSIYLYAYRGFKLFTPITPDMDRAKLKEVLGRSSGFCAPYPFRKINRLSAAWVANRRKRPPIHVFLWTSYMGAFSHEYKSII